MKIFNEFITIDKDLCHSWRKKTYSDIGFINVELSYAYALRNSARILTIYHANKRSFRVSELH